MPKMPLKLGKKSDYGCCPAPCGMSDSPYFPTVVIDSDAPLGFPDEGTMTVRFKVCREVEEKEPRESCSVTLKLVEITSMETDPEAEKEVEDTGKALKKLRDEVEEEEEY